MAKGYRFNPPPNWPTPPRGWEPARDWRKPPEWPEPPVGWQLWVPVKSNTGWVLGVVGGVVGVIVLVAAVGAAVGGGDKDPVAASTPTSAATTPNGDHHSGTLPPCTETGAGEPCNLGGKGGGKSPSDEPTTHKPVKPKPHKHISTRKFRLIAKDPDSYIGKRVIIFGEVTQFDSATGPKTFLADSGADKKYPEYGFVDYEQNSMFTGTKKQLGGIVEDDLVKVRATCLGSMDYETQIGGETTVPLFQVDKIKRYGSVDS